MKKYGEVYRISISVEKGSKKYNINKATLIESFGIEGDAHAGSQRQVSLLQFEAFDEIRKQFPDIKPGDFAENVTTRGFDFSSAAISDHLYIGDDAHLVITHIGKECHNGCEIKRQVGDCIMPRLGIFASIIKGGLIQIGDKIRWESSYD